MTLIRPNGHRFVASVRGTAVPATRPALVRAAVRHPWSTVMVSARIRLAGGQVVRARTAADAAAGAHRTRGGSVTSTQYATARVIDPDRWPDVAALHGSAARGRIARALFRAAVSRLPVRVRVPGDHYLGAGSPAAPVMVVHDPAAFFTRLGSGGLIGFGESYMAGEWDCADLTGLLTVFATHVGDLVPTPLQRMRRLAVRGHPTADEQTKDGARRNIGRHYDLSNELFALFLDETMTYSSALFETTGRARSRGQAGTTAAVRRSLPSGCSPRRSGARSTGCSTRRGWDRAAGSSRSAPAGASWRSGPRAARRIRPHGHDLRQAAASSRPAGWPRPGWPGRSAWNCATTGTWTASSTRSARWR